MKHGLGVFWFALLFVICGAVSAQSNEPAASAATASAATASIIAADPRIKKAAMTLKQAHPDLAIEYSAKTGLPKTIKGLVSQEVVVATSPTHKAATLNDVDDIVAKFFVGNRTLFLQSGPRQDLKVLQKKLDPQIEGRAIAKVQQTVKGIDVYGAEASVSVNLAAAAVEKLNVTFVEPPNVDTQPGITEGEASAVARAAYKADLERSTSIAQSETAAVGQEPKITTKLVILDPSIFKLPDHQHRLVWVVRVGTFKYFIDAKDKTVIHRFRDFPSGRNRMTYDLKDTTALPGTLILDEQGPQPGVTVPADATAAHDAAKIAYDFYFDTFRRDSYDNKSGGGSPLKSSVRFSAIHNAYWDPNNLQMVYGVGYSNSMDVVGHEITHGVIGAEVNLDYTGESGAANEAFADFFGISIAAYQSHSVDWKIGELIPGYSPTNPLRDMANPHINGFKKDLNFDEKTNYGQPDNYDEIVGADDAICSPTNDYYNGCVHFNSGILNKAFYLATAGGAGTGVRSNIAVVAIGLSKMQQILYRTLTAGKLSPVAQMKDVAKGAVESCNDLVSGNKFGITNADCGNLGKAFLAVGIPSS